MSFISRIWSSVAILAGAIALTGCVDENLVGKNGNPTGSSNVTDKIINTPANAAEGELLICLSNEAATKSQGGEELAEMVAAMGATKFEKVFKETEQNSRYLKKYNLDKWYHVVFDGTGTEAAALALAQRREVARVQYNTIATQDVNEPSPLADEMTAAEGLPFNDKYLKDQWNYINTGDAAIAPGAEEGVDVGVKDVWSKLTAGDSEIIVAVLDGPVKHTHPDLKDNMWVNPFEIANDNIDNDNNGYIDDIHGWNFVADTCKIGWDVPGASGHGTHVAGIVAAVNNNGIGVSGVAGGSGKGDGVRLMSCEVVSSAASLYSAAYAFIYAADNGAHIAQCSWGYETTAYKADYDYFTSYGIEYWAIQYFLDKERFAEMETNLNSKLAEKGLPTRTKIIDGPIIVFASGNSSFPASSYPGALMDCICVTAIGPDGLPAYYTNFGPGCNIAAPGGDYYLKEILSTEISDPSMDVEDYSYRSGTSMAAPHVSGIAALGLAYAKKLGKTFSREDFTTLLLSSVNDIDSKLSFGYKNLGVDNTTGVDLGPRPLNSYQYNMGTGTIDAWKFMMNLEGTPCLSVKVGNKRSYNLDAYFGKGSEGLTYLGVEIDRETMVSLGIKTIPSIENGKLLISPCKVGSGKLKITAIAGGKNVAGNITGDYTGYGDYITFPNPNGGMGGMEITREISIISRGVASDNGGWL